MEDKDRPFSFEGIKLGIIDGNGFKELPIVEDSVQHWGYYDAPELRESMESINFNVNLDNPNMTQFGKLFGSQIHSQIDDTMRNSVIIETEPYIKRPKNLKYPNKKRARRIWNKWRNRYGVSPSKQVFIPRAVISFKPEFKNNQFFNTVEIVAEKTPE